MDRLTLERQAKAIERWKAKTGVTGRDYIPLNSGVGRTSSKRALLQAIADSAKDRKERPRFRLACSFSAAITGYGIHTTTSP